MDHFEEFESLKRDLKELTNGKRVYFFANPGNWGDALIREGAVKLLHDAQIPFVELHRKPISWIVPFLLGGVFIYGGSGAWCRFYNTGEKYVKLISKRFKTIVLPSTYEKPFNIRGVTFYRRDNNESFQNMPDSTFCHDMAFYLGRQEFPEGRGEGYIFRQDAETNPAHTLPKENFDLSRQGKQLTNSREFFATVARYNVLYTDRLHVAIAACLLNREVHLYTNNYFKIRAIYETSLKEYFPNCYFHTEPFSQESRNCAQS